MLKSKIYFIIVLFIRITLILAVAWAIYTQNWIALFVSILNFILSFLPKMIEKKQKIDIPIEFEFWIITFLYASMFLGEVCDYYTKFWWWDIILHASSATAIGFIGFTLLFILYTGNKIKEPWIIALFSFLFALGIGAIWEIFEFSMDQLFGLNMQRSGLIDTMWDIIADVAGALVAAISGYFYLINGTLLYKFIIDKFSKTNPELFKEKVTN